MFEYKVVKNNFPPLVFPSGTIVAAAVAKTTGSIYVDLSATNTTTQEKIKRIYSILFQSGARLLLV